MSILIHSKSHVNYLAELGLRFDAPITFEEAKSLSEPLHTSNTNKQNYKIYIELAEVIGNRLSIKLRHACKECAIVLEQPSINSVEQYPISSNNCEIKVTVPRILPGAIVHLTQNGKPISNKVVVILDDVVSRSNPNKRLRDIQSLLNSNCTWQNRIEELVSYMYFEDEISTPSIQKHISSPSTSNKQSKSISAEDFDKIEFKQKQQILNNPNVLIAEFLMSGIQSLRSLSSSDDDIGSYEDVDSGTIKEQSSKKHTEEPIDDIKYIKSILRYVNKFINNGLLAKLKSFNEGCKDGMLGEITYQGVAINDFSHCAVALILINDILQNKRAYIDQEHYHKIKAFATTLIGSFSILHRESLECDGSYRQLKMQDFTKAILLYALNVISTFTWAGEDRNTENLLVMNLLDLCKRDISCCVELSRKLKGKQAVSIDVNLCRIRQRYESLIKSYIEFTRVKNSAHIEEFGLYFKSGFMYKQKYGFLHIDFLRRAKDNLRVFAVSHPAFDKPKEMKNGDKYVAVHI